jgi:hypothetical protein
VPTLAVLFMGGAIHLHNQNKALRMSQGLIMSQLVRPCPPPYIPCTEPSSMAACHSTALPPQQLTLPP